MYYLIIIKVIGGLFTQDASFTKFEMNNLEACSNAARWITDNSSSHIGVICMSKETGEIKSFRK